VKGHATQIGAQRPTPEGHHPPGLYAAAGHRLLRAGLASTASTRSRQLSRTMCYELST
jgi:hypothetical protein